MDTDGTAEENVELTERELFRKQISSMSFEDLLKLKDKIGTKEYNNVVFGTNTKMPAKSFKRANKNRPRETTSKKRVNLKESIDQTKPQKSRDPRFDPLCGTFDATVFKSNYKFVQDIKTKERAQLQREYNNEENQQRKAKIKFLMSRMDNQQRELEKTEKQQNDVQKEKHDIKSKLLKGEKHVFKRKSVKRTESLINKYEELKKNNKLQKHFKKQYKKLAQKDRKSINSPL